ncbi:pentatricopeptide repeat (PPR) superfamily protein [Actinidia rufa]|uniref:Pentatricopeptide repeat (PPR) superfamily protein n=1 Tax=Actinidia rufa TaxID=165716 RepID=A0A7J0FJR2_9ERIC|nr:pentatricopeptide repeat (PPR) superfamily protein [Actinidia rufa]
MGTKVHCKSYLPGYCSMRDLNEDYSSSNWPLFYGDKPLADGQYYNSLLPRTVTNAYPGDDKDALKQTMLEHEAVFKHQVFELHRLYKIQRDMMDEIGRKEPHDHRMLMETSSSSSPLSGCSSKDCEILEFRPSKARKKLFDLQLPPDQYIDTEEGEQSLYDKTPDIEKYPPKINDKITSESSVKLNFGGVTKIDCDGDGSRFGSCLRNSVGFADLNEPIQVEEAALPGSVGFIGGAVCHAETKDLDGAAKSKSHFLLGLSKEVLQNSQHRSSNLTSSKLHIENRRVGREWLPYMLETGHSKTHPNSSHQGLQSDKSFIASQLMHATLDKVHQPLGILSSDHSRGDLGRERTVGGLGLSARSRDLSCSNYLEPVLVSHLSNPNPLVHASDLDNAWSHSISTSGKPNTLKHLLTATRFFKNKWHLNSCSGSKPVYGSCLPTNCNGFYHGSSSGSKDVLTWLPSAGFDYFNCNKYDKVTSERSINYGARSFLKGSHVIDISDDDRKCEGHLEVFPWLKAKPANNMNEGTSTRRDSNSSELSFLQAASNQFSSRSETVKASNQLFTQKITVPACDNDVRAKRNGVGDCRVNGKIFGFPIFANPCTPKTKSSSVVSASASIQCPTRQEDIKSERKNGLIDINLACDPESGTQIAAEVVVVEKGRDKKVANFRTLIDLNACASEDEVKLSSSIASTSVNVKIAVEINLEVPAVPETEEDILPVEDKKQHEVEQPQDEAVRIAADIIVAISSSDHRNRVEETTCNRSEVPSEDSLLWFVEVVSSFVNNLERKLGTESRSKHSGYINLSLSNEIDDFEAMTLNLTEVTEEEYMPKPLVPEILGVEETGTISLMNRPRRGQARRGRPRRDFQRDILPGLASLSRHEVTEDLQTFGGLMRATGHVWYSGLTRRNGTRNGGAARGRRRSVVDTDATAAATATVTARRKVHCQIVKVGSPDSLVLTGLVDMYAKCGDIECSREVFDEIDDSNVVSWTSMIVGYVQNEGGGFDNDCTEEDVMSFNQMRDGLCEGNQYIFASIVTACTKLGASHQGKWVHRCVIKKGIELDSFLGIPLVDMYVKCGAMGDAQSLFDELHTFDLVSWTAMIVGFL